MTTSSEHSLLGKFEDLMKRPDSEVDDIIKSTSCALSSPRPCCQGRGYQLKVHGAKTIAVICDCVRACPTCLGHALIIDEDKESRSCQTPSPVNIVNLINDANIPARYVDASLDRFTNETGNSMAVIADVKKWLHNFKPIGYKGLLVGGTVGVGKTYILASIAKELAHKEVTVRFVDFFQLIAQIKAGFSEKKSDLSFIQPLIDVDVLLIDELGKGRNTEFELTVLDQLVMGRYNSNKITVATTNCKFRKPSASKSYNIPLDQDKGGSSQFAPDEFDTLESRVGQRIYSRLLETTYLLEMYGDDFRRSGLR